MGLLKQEWYMLCQCPSKLVGALSAASRQLLALLLLWAVAL